MSKAPPQAPSSTWVLRSLCPPKDDALIQNLLALERRLWKKSDSWGPHLAVELAKKNAGCIVAISHTNPAQQEEVAVGYVLFSVSGLIHAVLKLLVAPQFRRRGIGRALLQRAIGDARSRRRDSVMLHVDVDNVPALRLYESLGFQREGILQVSWFPWCIASQASHRFAASLR
jgi:ribosomal protein S18 acetylase RimI-like enzyme